MLRRSKKNSFLVCSLGLLASLSAGCAALQHRPTWPSPAIAAPDPAIVRHQFSVELDSLDMARAEVAYAAAFEAMKDGNAECVDEFFCAAQSAWHELERQTMQGDPVEGRAAEIYRSSLNALISEGQRYQRLDPRSGLRIQSADGWITIPLIHHGFLWCPEDFTELATTGDYSIMPLRHAYRRHGLGVPTVVVRRWEKNRPFLRNQHIFGATLVLRPIVDQESSIAGPSVLELYDPLRTSAVVIGERSFPLAHDSTAPIARVLNMTERNYLRSFLQPGLVTPDAEGLFMLEPYQAGKIPVVFIHGLLSDRLTWANVVNEIHARPEFVERFQLWGFEYPTGEPFLRSAALLRRQLEQIQRHLDPDGADSALNQVVLVGHSMGGLISKMQITASGTQLWNSISHCRFDEIVMDAAVRTSLAEAVFFRPSPMVSRVIFIGTPHRGSALAQRAIGRVGSMLIEQPAELQAEHQRLLQDNPGAFSREFTRRIPTSIDLLEPNSPLLNEIERLPVSRAVRMHSIIGQGRWMIGNGDSDGVVPVSSAQHAGTVSEKRVDEKHVELPQDPEAIAELLTILRRHYSESNLFTR